MDAATFKKVFLPYHQKLFRIAFRLVGNSQCAEDMLQDSFVKLWEKREQLSEVSNMESFAMVILKNTCLDYLRKQKECLQHTEEELAETESVSEQIERKDEVETIEKYILHLPEKQRTVMQLKHWDEMTNEEIEHATGYSQENIRVLLSRGRAAVREHFNTLRR